MSLWTVSPFDQQNLLDGATRSLIEKNVQYVMRYRDGFIDWKGTLRNLVNALWLDDVIGLFQDMGWTI